MEELNRTVENMVSELVCVMSDASELTIYILCLH